jgi:hypothetical protein
LFFFLFAVIIFIVITIFFVYVLKLKFTYDYLIYSIYLTPSFLLVIIILILLLYVLSYAWNINKRWSVKMVVMRLKLDFYYFIRILLSQYLLIRTELQIFTIICPKVT